MSEETTLAQPQPVRKQQQRSIVTQQKLLDAAIEAFSENGFKGTSTRDIAARAGVHHPLITYHFKNKDQLWRAAADHIFSAFTRSLSKSLEENRNMDAKKRMSAMIYAYVNYAKSQPALHKVMVQEASCPSPRLEWLIDTHLKPFFEASFSLLGELQDLGIAPAGNPALLFNMIRLSSGGLLALGNELKESSNIDIEDPRTLDEIAAMIIRVFLPGEMPAAAAKAS
ncbi:MAG: TetR/AcrR family transcriptional regulator [Proteobacteria bacterium]|nr:TetR/AcrR family transcriptional regulator [Pseudomonadota bacterium]MCH9005141.1 TetR/AcrR family transcriptional regulator [Pseudomonadota bacterium]